jgi:hypothetical protein
MEIEFHGSRLGEITGKQKGDSVTNFILDGES